MTIFGKGGQVPEMVPTDDEDARLFESLIRLGAKLTTRTAHPDAWGGQWLHVFSIEMDDDEGVDTWWSVCTRANGADTSPGEDAAPLCPECMRLVTDRGGAG